MKHQMKLGIALCALVALALTSTLAARPAAAQKRTFSEETAVVVVEIPVQVQADGNPVRGLTADNFEVLDGRKSQPLVGFDVVDLGTVERVHRPADQELSASGRRHFFLLFDLSFSRPASIVKAREAARDLMRTLHPTDMVAVGTYSVMGGAKVVLGFTPDRKQAEYALETLGYAQMAEAVREPLGVVLADLENFGEGSGEPAAGGSRAGGIDPGAELLQTLTAMEEQLRRDAQTNEILALSAAFEDFAKLMDSVQGRKHVVFLSEGFDSSIFLGTEDQARIQEMTEQIQAQQYWEVNSDERYGNTTLQNKLNQMLGEFRRSDCTIQAVDIGGLRAGADVRPGASGQDGLFYLANETGGEFYRNFNNLDDAMGEMLERTSVTYVLAIQPRNLKLDGEFHKLKVKLKNVPRGARAVHRPGYYAPLPYSEQTALQRRFGTAEIVLAGGTGGRISTSVLATPIRMDSAKAYVPVLMEIDGPSLLGGLEQDVLPTELYGYALDSEGTVRDYFAQSMGFDLGQVRPVLEQSGFKFWGSFDLGPGDYTLRLLVRNSVTGDHGITSVDVTVPTADLADATLLPPLFPEPGGKWMLGRQTQKEGDRQVPYPFMIGGSTGQAFIPAAKPQLASRQAADVCLVGYNLGNGDLAVSSQLFDLNGAPVEGAEIQLKSRDTPATTGAEQLLATFVPGGVRAGEYKLVVTVKDPATGRESSSSIPVSVGS